MAMFDSPGELYLDNEHFKAEIKRLEEENAALKETVKQLRSQLAKQTPPRRSRSWNDDYDYLPYEEDDRS